MGGVLCSKPMRKEGFLPAISYHYSNPNLARHREILTDPDSRLLMKAQAWQVSIEKDLLPVQIPTASMTEEQLKLLEEPTQLGHGRSDLKAAHLLVSLSPDPWMTLTC